MAHAAGLTEPWLGGRYLTQPTSPLSDGSAVLGSFHEGREHQNGPRSPGPSVTPPSRWCCTRRSANNAREAGGVKMLRPRQLRKLRRNRQVVVGVRVRRCASFRAISESHASGLPAAALNARAERHAWSNVSTTTCSAAVGSIRIAYTCAYTESWWRAASSR